jgi:hypothetical protein
MDTAWLRQLQSQVTKRKRTFEASGCRQSRRIEGIFDRNDEVSGFRHLCIYVDAGLVGKEQQIAKILACVDGQVFGYEHYNHTRWLMFFGIEQDKLTATAPVRVHQGIRASNWEATIRKFISPDAMSEPLILPRLRTSEAARTRCPDRYDLGLFFCRSRDLLVRSEEEQTIYRQIGSRCIWMFFGEEEMPQMETGLFVPQVVASCIKETV